jgi:sec-independent protein translocase protein TatA
MFNIGMGELLVIVVVGLLVFGPDKMPAMMRNFGKAMHAFQTELTKATAGLREGLELSETAKPAPPPVPPPDVPPDVRLHEDT